jgi:hypothetical protein
MEVTDKRHVTPSEYLDELRRLAFSTTDPQTLAVIAKILRRSESKEDNDGSK